MKKAVRRNPRTSPTIQAAPAGTVQTVTTAKSESRNNQTTASPTPVWSRYVDSRLKQFCLR